jgi:hypothetical protein
MAELIREHSTRIESEDGTLYLVRTYGQERADGTWEAWLEFHPVAGPALVGGVGEVGGAAGVGVVLRTGRETSQSNREGVAYWASGLEPVYLEGAFARAS